jgi:DNA-binding IclR family transcriptional regulator
MPTALSSTTAFQKPLRILKAMSDPRNRRLKEIAKAAGIDTASAHRALQALVDEGFVQREDIAKKYFYGEEAYILARALQARQDLTTIARPFITRLAAVTGDLISLIVRSGNELVCVDRENGSFPIVLSIMPVGTRRPLGIGAGSLALLSWCKTDELEATLAGIDTITAKGSRVTSQTMRKQIEATRKRGYSRQFDHIVPYVGALGLPVRGLDGNICGAVCVSALSKRIISREKMLVECMAKEIGEIEKIFHSPPPTKNDVMQ